MTQSNQTKSPFQIDPCDNTITLVRGNTCPLKITPTQEIEGVKFPTYCKNGDRVIFTIKKRDTRDQKQLSGKQLVSKIVYYLLYHYKAACSIVYLYVVVKLLVVCS